MKRWNKVLLAVMLIGSVFLSGCLGRERVLVPPRVDLRGAESIAVLNFENYTDDSGLAYEVEERIRSELSEYYYVAERSEVESALARMGLRRYDVPTREEIIRLGHMLDVDAVVSGEVSFYFQEITQHEPYIRSVTEDGSRANWQVAQRTLVLANFTGRVINTRNGTIMYTRRAEGEAAELRESTLSWTNPKDPPGNFYIPSPSRLDIPSVRSRAITDAVRQFNADLLPTYVWQKIEK